MGCCRLKTFVVSLSIVVLSFHLLGLSASILSLLTHSEICIDIEPYLPRCLARWSVPFVTWTVFGIFLANSVGSLCLAFGSGLRIKFLIWIWTVLQISNLWLCWAALYFWIGYLNFGFDSDPTAIGYSTLAFLTFQFFDLALLVLVILDSFPQSSAANLFRTCLVECIWLVCLGRRKKSLWI